MDAAIELVAGASLTLLLTAGAAADTATACIARLESSKCLLQVPLLLMKMFSSRGMRAEQCSSVIVCIVMA